MAWWDSRVRVSKPRERGIEKFGDGGLLRRRGAGDLTLECIPLSNVIRDHQESDASRHQASGHFPPSIRSTRWTFFQAGQEPPCSGT